MKFKISIDPDEAFVLIKVYEPVTAAMQRDFSAEAIALAKKHGVDRYLVDVRGVPNIAYTLDQYRLPYEDLRALDFTRTSRIVVIISEGDTSHNFIETVFSNAGYNCRLFVDEDDARNWLLR